MIYILFNNKSYNIQPEISYGGGAGMPFKYGHFIFDTENTDQNFWERENQIEIDSERFNINKKLVFKNEKRATIVYLRLKIDEMEKNSMSFFMPSRYEKLKKEFKQMVEDYPEYVL